MAISHMHYKKCSQLKISDEKNFCIRSKIKKRLRTILNVCERMRTENFMERSKRDLNVRNLELRTLLLVQLFLITCLPTIYMKTSRSQTFFLFENDCERSFCSKYFVENNSYKDFLKLYVI